MRSLYDLFFAFQISAQVAIFTSAAIMSFSALAASPAGIYKGICSNMSSNAATMKVTVSGSIVSIAIKNQFGNQYTTDKNAYDMNAKTTTLTPYGFKSTNRWMSPLTQHELVQEFSFDLVGNTALTRSYENIAGDPESGGITKSCTFAKN